MNIIINNKGSLQETIDFLKTHFEKVEVQKNEGSHLSNVSQNFFTTILFQNRNIQFKIKWNYLYSTLHISESVQYRFTKMGDDFLCPIEDGNNSNIMFWEYEVTLPHDSESTPISPLRIPVKY